MRHAALPSMTPATTPESVAQTIQAYLDERHTQLDHDQQAEQPRAFTWCGDVFDFLIEGLAERLAAHGIHFSSPFPGPFRLWDEEQRPDGEHVRRFWTTALRRGCPVAKLCTMFFHRHDTAALPRTPQVVAYPADHRDHDETV